ncbi:uncharacterized protein LOC126899619 isoform X2 [Daktulosphaira vitifoliae]|uniref:uncharacterized protein LOC126899619 isoform X2 n=1 Tax=Daktulosphaira vitifoliae TaxID=58002 RepID=UPI0021AAAE75|nr:uncharacterized protein LOC126899619 isoform X2 [Daktulosphaira vitifoliae]
MNVAKLLLAFATFTLIYVSAHPIDTTHTAKEHVNEFFNHFKKSEEIDNIKLLIDDYAKKIDIVYGNAQETLKAQVALCRCQGRGDTRRQPIITLRGRRLISRETRVSASLEHYAMPCQI